MTEEQMEAFEKLTSVSERAVFLLEIGVAAELDTEEQNFVFRACVGDMHLPIIGVSKLTAIKRGTAWLQEKAKEIGEGSP